MAIKAVVFDFDGVIVDSEVRFLKIVESILAGFGEVPLENELLSYTGTPPAEMFRRMRQLHPKMSYLTTEELFDHLRSAFEQSSYVVEPMPGIQEFFDFLEEKGIKTALATSRDRGSAYELMRNVGLRISFDITVTHNDITKGKPDPETYLTVADRFSDIGIRKEELLVLEDSRNGIAASKGAGLFTAGFCGSLVIQDTSAADIELSSYDEVKAYMEGHI